MAAALASLSGGCAYLWPSAGVAEMMQKTVDPSAKLLWMSVATSVTAEGVKETFPRSDREWDELRRAASALAESGALLEKDRRAEGRSEWMKWSQSLVEAAADTLSAVDAKSPPRILAAGEKIYNTCVGCHGRYSMLAPPP